MVQFTDADGEVLQEFAQKLQDLSKDNSKGDLSIEKFLTRSEEKFFDKVRKDKLSNAAMIRSSQHGCVWGSPSVHDCFPSRE
jgi:alpha-1,3-glucan synthase